eukprot:scaffold24143_cov146-Isochrysis_galbana.AAC.9
MRAVHQAGVGLSPGGASAQEESRPCCSTASAHTLAAHNRVVPVSIRRVAWAARRPAAADASASGMSTSSEADPLNATRAPAAWAERR